VLEKFCSINADAVAPRMRLMELAAAEKDWKAVRKCAEEVLGIDPLGPVAYRQLAAAAGALGDRATAIEARQILLLMDPLDKPEQHYQLAALMFEEGRLPEARHEVDLSLEDAPRYREALALLLKIADKMDATGTAPQEPPSAKEPK
jgi:tetratricopeptide (TPR) repeat protein